MTADFSKTQFIKHFPLLSILEKSPALNAPINSAVTPVLVEHSEPYSSNNLICSGVKAYIMDEMKIMFCLCLQQSVLTNE